MALGTYDREEEKKKVSYNPNGTTTEEKDDRSAGQIDVAPQNVAVAPTQASTPPQDSDTSLESQGGVNSDAGKENQQGQVQQDTPQMQELYPDETQGVKDENATPVATGTNFTNSDDMPQRTGVKAYNGFNFNTVTADGKSLSDTDIEGYYNMLVAKSKETGMPVEEIDKALGNNLISAPEQKAQPPVESAKNDNITTNEGKVATDTTGDVDKNQARKVTKLPPGYFDTGDTSKGTATPDNATASASSAEDNGKGGSTVVTGTPTEDDYYNGWKDWNVDDLKAILPANSDNPEKKAAIERLIKEKGGEVAASQGEGTVSTGTADAKKTPELTEQEQKDKDEAKAALKEKYGGGNVDMTKRPVVSEKAMQEAGWAGATGNKSVYPQLVEVKDRAGKKHKVLMSPICQDGSILTPEEFKQYVGAIDGLDDMLDFDRSHHGIILKVDATSDDVDEMDDLLKKAINGELVTEVTEAEGDEKEAENDPLIQELKTNAENAKKEYEDAAAKFADPNRHVNSVVLDDIEKRKKEYEEETEAVKKRQKRSQLIANIGDVLQGFANLAGAWYGAKSSNLTSLSAAAGASAEKELTQREKRRKEFEESYAKAKEEFDKGAKTNVDLLMKRMEKANDAYEKYRIDAAKSAKASRQRMKEEKEKRKMMIQRDALNWAQREKLENTKSRNRKEELGVKYGLAKDLKQTAPGKNPSNKKNKNGRGRGRQSQGSLK